MFFSKIEDDVGGISETTKGTKGISSGLTKSSSVVGINSNGKMSRHPGPATTTTISNSTHLAANHNGDQEEDEEYISSSEGDLNQNNSSD